MENEKNIGKSLDTRTEWDELTKMPGFVPEEEKKSREELIDEAKARTETSIKRLERWFPDPTYNEKTGEYDDDIKRIIFPHDYFPGTEPLDNLPEEDKNKAENLAKTRGNFKRLAVKTVATLLATTGLFGLGITSRRQLNKDKSPNEEFPVVEFVESERYSEPRPDVEIDYSETIPMERPDPMPEPEEYTDPTPVPIPDEDHPDSTPEKQHARYVARQKSSREVGDWAEKLVSELLQEPESKPKLELSEEKILGRIQEALGEDIKDETLDWDYTIYLTNDSDGSERRLLVTQETTNSEGEFSEDVAPFYRKILKDNKEYSATGVCLHWERNDVRYLLFDHDTDGKWDDFRSTNLSSPKLSTDYYPVLAKKIKTIAQAEQFDREKPEGSYYKEGGIAS